jgi:hypothetical protein
MVPKLFMPGNEGIRQEAPAGRYQYGKKITWMGNVENGKKTYKVFSSDLKRHFAVKDLIGFI